MNLVNWRKSFHLDRSRQIARVLLSHGWNFLRNNDERVAGPTPAITAHTRLVDVFLDLGVTQQRIDRASVGRDIERLLSTYWGLPLGDLKVTALLNDVYSVMRRHHLHLPANLALLLKTVIMISVPASGLGTLGLDRVRFWFSLRVVVRTIPGLEHS